MKRVFLIVLDGVGCGSAHDAAAYGDAGSDTLGNTARAVAGSRCRRSSRSGSGGWGTSRACAAWSTPKRPWG